MPGNGLFNFGCCSLHQEFRKVVNLSCLPTPTCQALTFVILFFLLHRCERRVKLPHSPATCCPYCKLGTFCFRPGTSISCHHHFISHPELVVTFPCTFQPFHYINFSPPEQDPNPLPFSTPHSTSPDDSLLAALLCLPCLWALQLTKGVSVGCQFRRGSMAGAGSVSLCHVTGWVLWESSTPAVIVPWIFPSSDLWWWLLLGSTWAMCQAGLAGLGMTRAEMVPGWHLPCVWLDNSVEWPPSTKMYH